MGGAFHAGSKVYVAVDPRTEARVAIRVFPAQVAADPEVLRGLRESLRSVARLDHPNIPRVLGSGVQAGRPFVVFPYLAAGSLQDRLASGLTRTLDPAELAGQLTAALSHAHEHGIVHGNLKPTKVLFDEDGVPEVIGFGEAQPLAQARSARPQDSRPRSAYEAPEIHRSGMVTPSADQYSLGVMLRELLTGTPPGSMHPADKLERGEAGNPAARPQHLPQSVWDVLSRATAADPRDRFGGVQEMHRALRVALGLDPPPQPVSLQPPRPPTGARRRKARLRLAWIGLLLTGLCVVITFPAFSARWEGRQLKDLPAFLWAGETPTQLADGRQAASLGAEEPTATPKGARIGDAPPTEQAAQPSGPAGPAGMATDPPADGGQSSPTDQAAPQATSTPVLPTSTVAPTAVPDTPVPTETPLPAPTTAPTTEPTKKPGKCKDDPSHPNYCTPTPP
jgi:serine/threonine protein kinase